MIDFIKIKGFRSIKDMQVVLKPLNILIGSNGSGKSNFVSFFSLLNAIANKRLQHLLMEEDIDKLLYFGRKITSQLYGELGFTTKSDSSVYHFSLVQDKNGGMFIETEGSSGHIERNLKESSLDGNNFLSAFRVFHFHDTSHTSLLRRGCDISDNHFVRSDGRNIPAILYLLKEKHPVVFQRIEKTIQSVAPYISRLILEPNGLNNNKIELRWVDSGDLESNFSVYQLSDGTLRFIALATLLMQPNPPDVIIIDEPELGLHPFAIGKLAGMIQAAASQSQIITATQSPGFISHFSPEDIIVIDKCETENQTVFRRLDTCSLKNWLDDYSLGELWERNIINGAQPFRKIV